MATLTDPGELQEDQRGKDLVEGAHERQHEQAAANNPDAPSDDTAEGTRPAPTRDSSGTTTGSATSLGGSGTSPGGARKGGSSRLAQAGKFIGGHKKASSIAGGSVVGIILLVVGLFGLLADKLEGVMASIFHKEMAKVENTIDKRAGKIVSKLIYDRATNTLAAADNPVLQKLYGQVPIEKIESNLATQGYKFAGSGTGTDAKLNITTPDGKAYDFNASGFDNFLNSSTGAGPNLESALESSSESVTHYVEVYQRRFLRLLVRNEFDFDSWKTFDGTTDATEANKEISLATEHAAIDPATADLDANLECITAAGSSDADCPPDKDTERQLPDGNTEGRPTYVSSHGEETTDNTPPSDAHCSAGDTACAQAAQAHGTDDVQTLTDGLEKEAGAAAGNEVAEDLTGKITSKLISGGNIFAVLNVLAGADKAIYGKDGQNTITRMESVKNEKAEIGMAYKFASMADELKTGKASNGKKISGQEINSLLRRLDATTDKNGKTIEPGIEGSQAFSDIIEGDPSKGVQLDPLKRIGNKGDKSEFGEAYSNSLGLFLHPVLSTYEGTVGKVFGWIGDIFAKVIDHIPVVNSIVESISDWLGTKAASFLNYLLGDAVTGDETGASLMNIITTGTKASAETFDRDALGAPAVKSVASAQIETQIALVERQQHRQLPLAQQLFDQSDPQSVVSQIALRLPGTPGSAVSQSGSYLASLFTSPVRLLSSLFGNQLFIGHAFADTDTTDINGIQEYGYTSAQLAQPLNLPTDNASPVNPDGSLNSTPDATIDQWDCPRSDGMPDATNTSPAAIQSDLCLADTVSLQSLISTNTTADDGGLGSH